MRTYTFHHYGRSRAVAVAITFVDCADDDAALREARRILDRETLSRVQVCDLRREVGLVKWDRAHGEIKVEIA